MKQLFSIMLLAAMTTAVYGDFTCPQGTEAACLDDAEQVCPADAKCVNHAAVCFDGYICDSGEAYVCESRYDEVAAKNVALVTKYNDITAKYNDLLGVKSINEGCVISAHSLAEAKECVG